MTFVVVVVVVDGDDDGDDVDCGGGMEVVDDLVLLLKMLKSLLKRLFPAFPSRNQNDFDRLKPTLLSSIKSINQSIDCEDDQQNESFV